MRAPHRSHRHRGTRRAGRLPAALAAMLATVAVTASGLTGVLGLSTAAAAPPGWLDRTYGTNGLAGLGDDDGTEALGAVDSSGRVVEILHQQPAPDTITRLTVDGATDPTFGTAGSTTLPSGHFGRVLVGSDGIYLLGSPATAQASALLAKLTPDGLLDSSFGAGGVATVTFPGFPASGLTDLAQLTDGTLILAGPHEVAAVGAGGDLDPSWNSTGATPGVITGLGDRTGLTVAGNSVVASFGGSPAHLTRWLRTGLPDAMFGSSGTAPLPAGRDYDGVYAGPGGYYLTAKSGPTGYRPRSVGRVLTDGTLDSSYGAGGFATLPVRDSSVGPSSSLVFRGSVAYLFTRAGGVTVARLTSTGVLDPTYGAGGLVQLLSRDLPAGQQLQAATAGGVQPDGRVVEVVASLDLARSTTVLGAVRYNADTVALAGSFLSLVPSRLLDTRSGLGAPRARVAGGATVRFQVAGRGGVPAVGAGAVVLNLTAVAPANSGHVTAYATGQGRPRSSSLNFAPGQTTANLAIVQQGAGGQVTLSNSSAGSVDLLADVVGYYLAGTPTDPGAFAAVPPARLLDTRVGKGAPMAPVARQGVVALTVAGQAGVPASGATAVVLNLTQTNAAGAGYVTAYPSGVVRPTASTLNHLAGETRANLVTVRVGSDGRVDLYNGSSGAMDLVADVAGYYLAGTPTTPGMFVAVDPQRVLDTRTGTGTARRPLHAGADITFAGGGSGVSAAAGASALVLTSTATAAARPGQLTVMGAEVGWPANTWDEVTHRFRLTGAVPPFPTSTVNFGAGQTVANLTVVSGSSLALAHNGSGGDVQVIADLAGYFTP